MEFINVLALMVVTATSIIGLARIAEWVFSDRQDDVSDNEAEDTVGEHLISALGNRVSRTEDRVNALYRHLDLVYRETPVRGEAVPATPIGAGLAGLAGANLANAGQAPLASTKPTKERSA